MPFFRWSLVYRRHNFEVCSVTDDIQYRILLLNVFLSQFYLFRGIPTPDSPALHNLFSSDLESGENSLFSANQRKIERPKYWA